MDKKYFLDASYMPEDSVAEDVGVDCRREPIACAALDALDGNGVGVDGVGFDGVSEPSRTGAGDCGGVKLNDEGDPEPNPPKLPDFGGP